MSQEKEIVNILDLVSEVIRNDIDRNYGDRDVYMHKLILAWHAFTDNELDEEPHEYMRRINHGPNIK